MCLITADPAWRIGSILEPLRPLADEVVIAADSRVDERTLTGYAALADRLFRIEFAMPERHLAWLCDQCRGDWILRIDGDEVPSEAFVRRLPDMLASRGVRQFWSAQAWLYPDGTQILSCLPWSADFHVRLIRNDGTHRFPGVQHLHIEAASPREYVEEPVYHLDLLLGDERRRRDKAIRYEATRPGLIATGGGPINEAFYLPELRDDLELAPVPEEDRHAIARALQAPEAAPAPDAPIQAQQAPAQGEQVREHSRASPVNAVPFASLQEMDRLWEGRPVPESAYRARIEPREGTCVLAAGEQRHVFFRVANQGTELWPADLQERPQIRLAYRWLRPDGSVHVAEGPRSPFPRRVEPGERVLAPVHVDAPATPGEYVLEVDVVHEGARWFGCACRVPAQVKAPPGA